MGYCVWCDDNGQVIDDGTIFHLREGDYRLCSQERQLDWLARSALGFDVSFVEDTHEVAALALQGPTSCAVLKKMGCAGIERLAPFGIAYFPFAGTELMVSRTGFTGDLGYELWIAPAQALELWDKLFAAGADHGIRPMGTHALEVSRIEAGFIQAGVDFHPADSAVRLDRSRSPFELDLGRLVDFKPFFNGRRAPARGAEARIALPLRAARHRRQQAGEVLVYIRQSQERRRDGDLGRVVAVGKVEYRTRVAAHARDVRAMSSGPRSITSASSSGPA